MFSAFKTGGAASGQGVLRLGLAAALLLQHLPVRADNLWTERRRAVEARGTLFAPTADRLADVLPDPSESRHLAPPKDRQALPAWLDSTIGLYGHVQEFSPGRPGGVTVIHVQDVHDLPEAQRNVAALLDQWARTFPGPLVVGLEGAAGPMDLAPYRRFVDPESMRRTAGALLELGVLTGPEVFGLTGAGRAALFGVENPRAYRAHVAAVEEAFRHGEADGAAVKTLDAAVEQLREKLLPASLRALARARGEFEEGRLPLGAYITALAAEAPPQSLGPATRDFLMLLAAEKAVDPAKAAEERQRLLARLAPALSGGELRRLLAAGLDHRLGRGAYAKFHDLLERQAKGHGLRLVDYPAYAAFERTRVLAEKIDGARLLAELPALADAREAALAADENQRAVLALSSDLGLLRRLSALALTPAEKSRLDERREEFLQLPARAAQLTEPARLRLGHLPDIVPLVARHDAFYVEAERRNLPMADRLAAALAKRPAARVAVLVAGGYHGPGLRKIFERRGLGYIAVSPRFAEPKTPLVTLSAFRPGGSAMDRLSAGLNHGLQQELVLSGLGARQARAWVVAVLAAGDLAFQAAAAAGPLAGPGETNFTALPAQVQATLVDTARRLEAGAGALPEPVALALAAEELTMTPKAPGQVTVNVPVGAGAGEDLDFRSAQFDVAAGAMTLRLPRSGRDRTRGWGARWRRATQVRGRQVLGMVAGSVVALASPVVRSAMWMTRRATRVLAITVWNLGRATGAVASFGASEANRFARWVDFKTLESFATAIKSAVDGWRARVVLDEHKRGISALGDKPLPVKTRGLAAYARLALVAFQAAWIPQVVNAIEAPGAPAFQVVSSRITADPLPALALVVRGPDGAQFPIRLSASNVPALSHSQGVFEDPSHRVMQWVPDPLTGGYDGTVQTVAMAPEILGPLMRHHLAEVHALRADPNLTQAAAHNDTLTAQDRHRLPAALAWPTYANGIYNLEGDLMRLPEGFRVSVDRRAMDRFLAGEDGFAGAVKVMPAVASREVARGEDPRINFSDHFVRNEVEDVGAVTRALGGRAGPYAATVARNAASIHFQSELGMYARLQEYMAAAARRPGIFDLGSGRARTVDALTELAAGKMAADGEAAGREAAIFSDAARNPDAALSQYVVERFPGQAETMLAALVRENIVPAPGKEEEWNEMTQRLFAIWRAGYDRGAASVRWRTPSDVVKEAVDMAPEQRSLHVGVFHMEDAPRAAPAARVLLRAAAEHVRSGTQDRFFGVVLTEARLDNFSQGDFAREMESLLNENDHGLDSATLDQVRNVLNDNFVVRRASQFGAETISIGRVVEDIRRQWPGRPIGLVQFVTTRQERFAADALTSAVKWVIDLVVGRDGLQRVSESFDDAADRQRLRQMIDANA